ncbi:MARVEL domain-containing protein 3-like [Heteronotia binoei]|uniref:MARVEL domain-containing protein 3-like n=1 Tax=Heteronotia binoei TaxID=13085 RepID=UPI00292DFEF0|nr:MARVEL domain-containing protein 3-like [Heteronotia binoei]
MAAGAAEGGRPPPGVGGGRPPPDWPAGASRSSSSSWKRRGLLDTPLCRYLCTARAGCRLLQLVACVLLIACSSVSYGSPGGYTGLFSLGSVYYQHYGGAYSGFAGADGEKAQRLDAQFHQLLRPPAQGAMAVGGGLLAWSALALAASLLRLPGRCPPCLLAEALLDAAAALGLAPGLYFYYAHLSRAYASPVCQEREQLYRSKGYAGFSCALHGAELAAGLFAGLALALYLASAALALRAFCALRSKRPAQAPDSAAAARRLGPGWDSEEGSQLPPALAQQGKGAASRPQLRPPLLV